MYFWTKTCCKLENRILQFECFKWCWPTPLQYFYLHVAVVALLLQHICSLQNMQRTYWGFQMCQVELSANILNNGIQLHTATCKVYCAISYDIIWSSDKLFRKRDFFFLTKIIVGPHEGVTPPSLAQMVLTQCASISELLVHHRAPPGGQI